MVVCLLRSSFASLSPWLVGRSVGYQRASPVSLSLWLVGWLVGWSVGYQRALPASLSLITVVGLLAKSITSFVITLVGWSVCLQRALPASLSLWLVVWSICCHFDSSNAAFKSESTNRRHFPTANGFAKIARTSEMPSL